MRHRLGRDSWIQFLARPIYSTVPHQVPVSVVLGPFVDDESIASLTSKGNQCTQLQLLRRKCLYQVRLFRQRKRVRRYVNLCLCSKDSEWCTKIPMNSKSNCRDMPASLTQILPRKLSSSCLTTPVSHTPPKSASHLQRASLLHAQKFQIPMQAQSQ